jgi:hypothetical protein
LSRAAYKAAACYAKLVSLRSNLLHSPSILSQISVPRRYRANFSCLVSFSNRFGARSTSSRAAGPSSALGKRCASLKRRCRSKRRSRNLLLLGLLLEPFRRARPPDPVEAFLERLFDLHRRLLVPVRRPLRLVPPDHVAPRPLRQAALPEVPRLALLEPFRRARPPDPVEAFLERLFDLHRRFKLAQRLPRASWRGTDGGPRFGRVSKVNGGGCAPRRRGR